MNTTLGIGLAGENRLIITKKESVSLIGDTPPFFSVNNQSIFKNLSVSWVPVPRSSLPHLHTWRTMKE